MLEARGRHALIGSPTSTEGNESPVTEWRRQQLHCVALHWALTNGNQKQLDDLLKNGGRSFVDERDEIGLAPLHRASIKGPAPLARALCRAGADREATFEGLTSLHMACGRGHEDVVGVLLEEGADRDARTSQGFTALHCASGRGGLGSVKVLLAHGADVNVRSDGRQRRTPLHAAAVLGDEAVTVELLRCGADVNLPDAEGVTSLHIASAVDNLGVARALLDAGASTESLQAGTLNTPLQLAAFQGSRSVVLALLDAGADVSTRNVNRDTPLHQACMMLDLAMVETLLLRGADESAVNDDQATPAGVLGRGLDEAAGTGAGDLGLRDGIARLLARAPSDRAWRRRSWLVLLRPRVSLSLDGHPQSKDGVEVTDRSRRSVEASLRSSRDQGNYFCYAGRPLFDLGQLVGGDREYVSCVVWVLGLQEEGIFREILSFV